MQARNGVSSLAFFLCFLMETEYIKCLQAKEVSKSNFLQGEQVKKQRWEESEKKQEDQRRERVRGKRCRCAKG